MPSGQARRFRTQAQASGPHACGRTSEQAQRLGANEATVQAEVKNRLGLSEATEVTLEPGQPGPGAGLSFIPVC